MMKIYHYHFLTTGFHDAKFKNTPGRRIAVLAVLLLSILLSACNASRSSSGETNTSNTIKNKGSDTLVNLALAWAEAYYKINPKVSIAVTGGGTGTGIAALLNGTVDIANASRKMTEDELSSAKAKGITPIEIPVAIDAIAVIVHPDNPISELTIDQLSDIFSGKITNWAQIGGRDAPIVLVSRESNSGTHVYFLEQVVRKGQKDNKDIFSSKTLLMPSSEGIISEIRRNPNAIGYDGLGYITEHEKMIAISKGDGYPYVMPSVATAADGSYPLSRFLYMYTAGQPNATINEYINWILSKDGQALISQLGFVPLGRK